MEIIEYDKDTGAPVRLNGEYIRDEADQATYLREVLEIFDTEGVDGTFVFPLRALQPSATAPAVIPVSTWTWRAPASSRHSRAATEIPTPTWPGSSRPPSPPSPNITHADPHTEPFDDLLRLRFATFRTIYLPTVGGLADRGL